MLKPKTLIMMIVFLLLVATVIMKFFIHKKVYAPVIILKGVKTITISEGEEQPPVLRDGKYVRVPKKSYIMTDQSDIQKFIKHFSKKKVKDISGIDYMRWYIVTVDMGTKKVYFGYSGGNTLEDCDGSPGSSTWRLRSYVLDKGFEEFMMTRIRQGGLKLP